jgi:hypothetical protein
LHRLRIMLAGELASIALRTITGQWQIVLPSGLAPRWSPLAVRFGSVVTSKNDRQTRIPARDMPFVTDNLMRVSLDRLPEALGSLPGRLAFDFTDVEGNC